MTPYVPKARINVFKQSFQYTVPSIYNALPNVIKESTTLHVLNPNSKFMLLIASTLLLSRYSVQHTNTCKNIIKSF